MPVLPRILTPAVFAESLARPTRVVIIDMAMPLSSIVKTFVKALIAILLIAALLASLYLVVVLVWMMVARPFA